MTRTEVIVTVVVGLGSGLIGAFAGGLVQRGLYRIKREDDRLDDLWEYQHALGTLSEYLTDERSGKGPIDLPEVEKLVYRHFRYLPPELSKLLKADEAHLVNNSYEIGEHLWEKATALRKYLEGERHPVRRRLLRVGEFLKAERLPD